MMNHVIHDEAAEHGYPRHREYCVRSVLQRPVPHEIVIARGGECGTTGIAILFEEPSNLIQLYLRELRAEY
jgi:hypothetical protein